MPGTMIPTTAAGVLGLTVFIITAFFAVVAIVSIAPRPKPRRKPARLVHVPVYTDTMPVVHDEDSTDIMAPVS